MPSQRVGWPATAGSKVSNHRLPVYQKLSSVVLSCRCIETHLHVCQVNVEEKPNQIVCGAPNVRTGIKVMVALPGLSRTVQIKKENPWLRIAGNDPFTCDELLLTQLYRGRWYSNLASRCGTR